MPEAVRVVDAVALLDTWGAAPMPVGAFEANLFDEYVDEALVVYQASISDERLIAQRLTDDERQGFFPEDSDQDDPDLEVDDHGGGADDGWGLLSDELDSARRVIVILERDSDDPLRVGNYRVHGAGQWIRESLWAATGVVPRDPGSASTPLYSQALDLVRPGRPDQPVALYERLPGRLWTAYVAIMRPRWRRARRRYLEADVGR
ncbi:hypothetical protein [Isoptericola croceus]|uniref:hypothetical protein n=1 Tax=Isoptericola croceus TaxID=3031406 RepID=UPI0023FA03DF|nr:hypothetical protein [Isoptericola croceus]